MSDRKTSQQLKEEAVRLVDEAETQSNQPTPSGSSPVPTPSASPAVPSASQPVPTPSASVPVPTSSPEVPETPKTETPPLKERFDASTREAQRLYKDNVHMSRAISDAQALPDPTDVELKGAYLSWEDMTDSERSLAKESFINRRFREHVAQAAEEVKKVEDWSDKVEEYLGDPVSLQKAPELEGKESDFRKYANDKTKVLPGTAFNLIVGSFLYEQSKIKKPANKGEMFPTGTGGRKEPKKPDDGKISLTDAEVLKQTDYKRYLELLKAKKIALE